MSNNNGKLSKRVWTGILLFMFMGLLAWNVENMYFNTFLNDCVYNEGILGASITLTDAVNIMVTLSAITAVVTTFIMGTLSEKLKNRKAFISFGYIAWGIVTALFGFITKDNVAKVFGLTEPGEIITATAWVVIVMDIVMTFMGSTSNDSAFNAWVTDVTTPESRPKVETASTFMGFIAMAVIMVVGGMATAGTISYSVFFIGMGAFVAIVGVAGVFLIDNPKKFENAEKRNTSYWADLFYGFRPSVIKENSGLYLVLSALCIFNIAFQVFFPYLIIYLTDVVLPANADVNFLSAGIIVPAVISVASIIAGIVILMKAAEKSKSVAFLTSSALLVVGLFILSTSTSIMTIIVGIAPVLIGYLVLTIQLGASTRDYTPQDNVGLFQGIRMVFAVLIPMVVGPTLGNIATKNTAGADDVLPTKAIFLYAGVVAIFVFIPMIALLKKEKKNTNKA
ncbi:MAG: MFS transporter [Clostridia bacterium]|nr:MFS transporter [Clostridia bacterium]